MTTNLTALIRFGQGKRDLNIAKLTPVHIEEIEGVSMVCVQIDVERNRDTSVRLDLTRDEAKRLAFEILDLLIDQPQKQE